jgi:uncharacterized phage protein (TIGR01671 family)
MFKFRGKTESGEWVFGYYYSLWGRHFIHVVENGESREVHEVIPETVGQFTGLLDKNSEEIYVDDIVRAKIYNGIVNREKVYDYETFVVKAISNNRLYAFKLVDKEGNEWSFDNTTELEIIGNKWDNSELEARECELQ